MTDRQQKFRAFCWVDGQLGSFWCQNCKFRTLKFYLILLSRIKNVILFSCQSAKMIFYINALLNRSMQQDNIWKLVSQVENLTMWSQRFLIQIMLHLHVRFETIAILTWNYDVALINTVACVYLKDKNEWMFWTEMKHIWKQILIS